jgi:hypothetical protein
MHVWQCHLAAALRDLVQGRKLEHRCARAVVHSPHRFTHRLPRIHDARIDAPLLPIVLRWAPRAEFLFQRRYAMVKHRPGSAVDSLHDILGASFLKCLPYIAKDVEGVHVRNEPVIWLLPQSLECAAELLLYVLALLQGRFRRLSISQHEIHPGFKALGEQSQHR